MASAFGLLGLDLLVVVFVFFQEPFDSPSGIDQFLFAGKKRMALGADFHPDILPGGTGLKHGATGAGDRGLMVSGMNVGFHEAKPLS
jgi:hypothetical protein